MSTMVNRVRADFRFNPAMRKLLKAQAKNLGLPEARYIELIVKFIADPSLMDKWMEALCGFQKAYREGLEQAKKLK
jgi:hypothetical protein